MVDTTELNANQQYGINLPGMPANQNMALQIEPRQIITELAMILQGKTLNDDGKVEDNYPAMINDKGINIVIANLRSKLNPAVVLANLEEEDVYQIALEVRFDLIELIYCKHEEYEIDLNHWSTMLNIIDHTVYCFLTRPKNDGERDFHKTLQKIVSIFKEGNINPRNSLSLPALGNRSGGTPQ